MSNQNISVGFKVSGTELSSYIDKIKEKADKLTQDAIAAAVKQTEKGKDQLRIINEQIAAMERKAKVEAQASRSVLLERRGSYLDETKDKFEKRRENVFSDKTLSETDMREKIRAIDGSEKDAEDRIKSEYKENLTVLKEVERLDKLQTAISKEILETLKATARENIIAITNGDKELADVLAGAKTSDEELIAKLTEEGLEKEKKDSDGDGGGKKKSIFGDLLAVDNINKFIAAAGQFSQTQNGFDLIQPASNTAGRIIGGLIGGAIGAFAGGVGAVAGAGFGASIGGGFGDAIGALQQREAMSKENFQKNINRYAAVTGGSLRGSEIEDLSDYGVNFTQFIEQRTDMAKRLGYASGSAGTSKDAIFAEKAYGVDNNTSFALVELQRSSRENNRNLAELIGGVIEKGAGSIFKSGDNSFLNEFLGKFTVLQKELLKGQTYVPTGTTMDIMTRFNKLEGEFDIRDPRAMGNINAIQSGLSNPGADNLKALSFSVLRQAKPGAEIFDLLEERQKGLGSPEYLKGMLGMLDRLGGNDQMKMVQLSGMFPGLSLSAVRRLYDNRDGLMDGSISLSELQSKNPKEFGSGAKELTTDLERNTALIENGILGGKSIERMADAFAVAVKSTLGGAVIELNNGQGKIKLNSSHRTGVLKAAANSINNAR